MQENCQNLILQMKKVVFPVKFYLNGIGFGRNIKGDKDSRLESRIIRNLLLNKVSQGRQKYVQYVFLS